MLERQQKKFISPKMPKNKEKIPQSEEKITETIENKEKPKQEFDSKILDLARVTRVTAGGKQLRFRAVVVVGNKNGKIGLGVAKGRDVSQGVEKAIRSAKKNVIEVPFTAKTIPYEVEAKFGPARVLLKPQLSGRGLVAGGVVRIICQLAGIKNISSKLLSRSRNKLNIARATIKAIGKLKSKISPSITLVEGE